MNASPEYKSFIGTIIQNIKMIQFCRHCLQKLIRLFHFFAITRPDPDFHQDDPHFFHNGLVLAPFRKPQETANALILTVLAKVSVIPDLIRDPVANNRNLGSGTQWRTAGQTIMVLPHSVISHHS